MPELIVNPLEYVGGSQKSAAETDKLPSLFPWPMGVLHFSGLLQDGFVNRLKDLPDDIRLDIGRILLTASKVGTLPDQKWALEVAGTTPSAVLLWLLRNAFASESQWLSEVAFRQTARLDEIPDDIARSIRQALMSLFMTGRLRRERYTTSAHLARLDKSNHFIDSLQLLLWIPPIDAAVHVILIFLAMIKLMNEVDGFLWITLLFVLLSVLSLRNLRPLLLYMVVAVTPQSKKQQIIKKLDSCILAFSA